MCISGCVNNSTSIVLVHTICSIEYVYLCIVCNLSVCKESPTTFVLYVYFWVYSEYLTTKHILILLKYIVCILCTVYTFSRLLLLLQYIECKVCTFFFYDNLMCT